MIPKTAPPPPKPPPPRSNVGSDMEASIDTFDSWDSLKSKSKTLKSMLDTKMQELLRVNSKLSATASEQDEDRTKDLEAQKGLVAGLKEDIEKGLSEFDEVNMKLTRVASSATQQAQVNRFKETSQELARDFKRVAGTIDHHYRHAKLLPKGRKSGAGGGEGDSAEANLMRERSLLDSTLGMADDVIAQAGATREMLAGQRAALGGISGKVATMASALPGVGKLIDNIGDRQTRESLVLALTVASCCCFTIWYKFL
eukprot:gnl/MRDRNA2_/MRDRNA2_129992_c0_seq1.p1 gnl/MRDRNA2_/MRDRNA2_129992_c0~~gnl/MRDRNA2_/MRDRNA2_129992_c0_seq1.p1  ORF type:complete len:256 (+),score=53.13 gnl/MRDRNA2_/MRDRNA2_129992_c0_seq1:43-810(+)